MSGAQADGRIERQFAALKEEGRGGLVTFVTAGDPNETVSREIVLGLPAAGADLIELGMPFSDPMADGPSVQASSVRALANGASLRSTLSFVRDFRVTDDETPIILMGYYNPIYIYGVDAFLRDANPFMGLFGRWKLAGYLEVGPLLTSQSNIITAGQGARHDQFEHDPRLVTYLSADEQAALLEDMRNTQESMVEIEALRDIVANAKNIAALLLSLFFALIMEWPAIIAP